jgi:hypothetical protein
MGISLLYAKRKQGCFLIFFKIQCVVIMKIDFVSLSRLTTIITIMSFEIIIAVLTGNIHLESFTGSYKTLDNSLFWALFVVNICDLTEIKKCFFFQKNPFYGL